MFSVIIPTYNRAELLRRAIQSLVSQTYKDFEVIVCDDGSTDHTQEVVSAFSDFLELKYIREENFGGPARPRNNGIRAASNEWICFLDCDDWWYPNKLEIISQYVDRGDILYHDLHIYNKGGRTFRKVKGRKLKPPVYIDLITNSSAIATSSVVVRKNVLTKVDMFDEDRNLIAMEDFDVWLKISRITEEFVYVPLSLGGYWTEEGHITEVSEKQIERINEVYRRHERFLSAEERSQVETIKSYAIGRIKWKLRKFEEAFKLFKVSSKSKNFEIRMKSFLMICLIAANGR